MIYSCVLRLATEPLSITTRTHKTCPVLYYRIKLWKTFVDAFNCMPVRGLVNVDRVHEA